MMDDAGIDACVLMGWSMGVNTMFEVAVTTPSGSPACSPSAASRATRSPRWARRSSSRGRCASRSRSTSPGRSKLAGKPLTEVATRLPVGPLTYEVLTHSGFMLPMPDPALARRAIREFLTTPIDWYMHLALHSSLHLRVSLRNIDVPTSFVAGQVRRPRLRRTTCARRPSGSPAPPTRSSAPPTSSRWRSPTRCTRPCSTCSTASRE